MLDPARLQVCLLHRRRQSDRPGCDAHGFDRERPSVSRRRAHVGPVV